MTHAEVQGRLGLYARGTLDDEEAARVRAHLASGCRTCLGRLFARDAVRTPAPSGAALPGVDAMLTEAARPATPPAGRGRGVLPLAALAAACVGLTVGVVARTRGGVSASAPTVTEPGTAADPDPAMDVDRLAALERRLQDAERRLHGVGPSARSDTATAESPVPVWLDDLLSTDGTRVIPLHASAIADGARGYALWTPSRDTVVIVGSALASGHGVYRVRIGLSDGSPVWAGDLDVDGRGLLVVTVGLPPAAGRSVVAVALYRDPPNLPALYARLEP